MTTARQAARSAHRTARGKFRGNACDCCGRPAPMDAESDERCNVVGYGLTLRPACARRLAALTDEQFAAEAASRR